MNTAAAAAGCGCAPNSWVRWVVFGVLVAGGIAIWFAGRRRARRGVAAPGDPSTPDGARTGRGWTERGPSAAAAVMIALAVVVAIVQTDAEASLAALVIGAIVASAGMGVRVGPRATGSSIGSSEDR